ncbi:serine/threonine-protein kinase bud32 [Ceratobasidium sp. 392]|nr:serine/threonine-protein kinase bud32 [Ceratobasidium sp. 392]
MVLEERVSSGYGVNVPGIRFVHADSGVLGIEWIEGSSVRKVLGGGAEGEEEGVDEDDNQVEEEVNVLKETYGLEEERLMELIGTEIAKMHRGDIIHGDLTTSNMMLRKKEGKEAEVVLIDFGLSYNSPLVEDKAVDLYVLERAFASTHPDSEGMFSQVLQSYERVSGPAWKAVKRRLDDVRLRGRKRSMVG